MSKDAVNTVRRTRGEKSVIDRADREIANSKAREQPLSKIPLPLTRSSFPKPETKHVFSGMISFLPPVENRSEKDQDSKEAHQG